MSTHLPNGFKYLPEYFDRTAQVELLAHVTNAARGGANMLFSHVEAENETSKIYNHYLLKKIRT